MLATKQKLKRLSRNTKRKFYDARHVCYAYVLNDDSSSTRANDDGEPSGTAGRPS